MHVPFIEICRFSVPIFTIFRNLDFPRFSSNILLDKAESIKSKINCVAICFESKCILTGLVTYITEISLHVTLSNQSRSQSHSGRNNISIYRLNELKYK